MTSSTVGHYTLLQTLGEGSFGVVRLAVDNRTGHEYAMKVLNLHAIKAQNLGEQVRREISILRRLDHPNVIRLVEVLKNKKSMFLVCELVRGGDLFDKLAAQQQFSEAQARSIFCQIALGVAYCHDNGIAHRDLKCENVLLTPEGSVKLADFGFCNAFWTESKEQEVLLKTICGTPSSIAPEILAHEMYHGTAVDVWSMGVILFYMVAGRLPFEASSNEELFAAIITGTYAMPPSFSAQLQDLVSRILVVDASQRITVQNILQHSWCTTSQAEPAAAAQATRSSSSSSSSSTSSSTSSSDEQQQAVAAVSESRSFSAMDTFDVTSVLAARDFNRRQQALAKAQADASGVAGAVAAAPAQLPLS